jgi:hypothetical protein
MRIKLDNGYGSDDDAQMILKLIIKEPIPFSGFECPVFSL